MNKLVVGHEVAWVNGHPAELATILEVLDRADHHGQRLYAVQPHSPDPEVEIFAGPLPEGTGASQRRGHTDGVLHLGGGATRTGYRHQGGTTHHGGIERQAVPSSGGFKVINATNDAVRVQVTAPSWGGLADAVGQVAAHDAATFRV
jgi:hypothetical protein